MQKAKITARMADLLVIAANHMTRWSDLDEENADSGLICRAAMALLRRLGYPDLP